MQTQKQIFILTGERGSGKTTACLAIIKSASNFGLIINGVVSPARFNLEKIGIDLLDLQSNQLKRLADVITSSQGPTGTLSTDRYLFYPCVVNWANDLIKQACPCDVLIIDELGPLELVRNQGWTNAVDVLKNDCYKIALVVVRPELVELFCRHFPDQPIRLFTLPAKDGIDPVKKITNILSVLPTSLQIPDHISREIKP